MVHVRNRTERARREEPDPSRRAPVHTFDEDVERPAARRDRADHVDVGLQWVRHGPFGAIAHLVQPGRQPGVEDDIELMRENGGWLAAQAGIQVRDRCFIVPVPCGAHETEQRPPRGLAAEGVLWRLCLDGAWRGRGCRRCGAARAPLRPHARGVEENA